MKAKSKPLIRPVAVLVLLLVAAVLILAARGGWKLPQLVDSGKKVEAQKATTEVPEFKEIFAADQNIRLTGGRKLVERVGVENALEILKNSKLPNTGEGHLVVHQVGFYAYKKYGADSILHCRDYFLYACYHGAIIEAASKEGFPAIKKMTDRCKDSFPRHFQCLHAAGHSILAIWDYNLPEALKTCDKLYEADSPDILTSCHNGAFMENLFGVHDWGSGKEVKREWLSSDPYFPCNAFSEKYQKGCWLNQAARIYQMYQGDLFATAAACRGVGNEQYSEWCLDNLSRQIHAMTNGEVARTFSLCQTLGPDWRDKCFVVNAGAFYSVGGRVQGIEICRLVLPEFKESCYQNVLGQLVPDGISAAEKNDLCSQMDTPFRDDCKGKIQVL